LVLAAGVSTALAGGEGEGKTIEGTLVDAKCYLRMGATGNDHMGMKGCGTMCAKKGQPVGLLTAEGKYYPLVVAAPQVAEHVGETLRASGTLKSGSLILDKLEMKEGDSWKEVKIGTMM
jgi:hypothetical protein